MRATQPLSAMLRDRKPGVRRAAIRALDTLGWKPDTGGSKALYEETKSDSESRMVPSFHEATCHDTASAVDLLFDGTLRSIPPLTSEATQEEYRNVQPRWRSSELIVRLHAALMIAPILVTAGLGCGRRPDPADVLIKQLAEAGPLTLRDTEAPLGISDFNRSVNYNRQLDICSQLSSLGQPALRRLSTAITDHDPLIRSAAVLALGRILGSASLDQVVSAMKDPSERVRQTAIKTLLEMLCHASRSADDGVRWVLDRRDGRVSAAMTNALKDTDLEVRLCAHDYFIDRVTTARSGEPEANPPGGDQVVVQLMCAALTDQDSRLRRRAGCFLSEVSPLSLQHVMEPLIRALHDNDPEIRSWACIALVKIKHPRARKTLSAAWQVLDLDNVYRGYGDARKHPQNVFLLVCSLFRKGDIAMALDFLNHGAGGERQGCDVLHSAGRVWADKHGYKLRIETREIPIPTIRLR